MDAPRNPIEEVSQAVTALGIALAGIISQLEGLIAAEESPDSDFDWLFASLIKLADVYDETESHMQETGEISNTFRTACMDCQRVKEAYPTSLPQDVETKWEALQRALGNLASCAWSAFGQRGIEYYRFDAETAPPLLVVPCEPVNHSYTRIPEPFIVKAANTQGIGCLMKFGVSSGGPQLDPGRYLFEMASRTERMRDNEPDWRTSLNCTYNGFAELSENPQRLDDYRSQMNDKANAFSRPPYPYKDRLFGRAFLIAPGSIDEPPETYLMTGGVALTSDSFYRLPEMHLEDLGGFASSIVSLAVPESTMQTNGDAVSVTSSDSPSIVVARRLKDHLDALLSSLENRPEANPAISRRSLFSRSEGEESE